MNGITILTPTYNRAHTLKKCYSSLISQTNKDFEWLVIDDGSTDDTEKLITEFIKENIISIKYLHKLNGGKHTAVNKAVKQVGSLLTLILDSDDYLVDDAIDKIYKYCNTYSDSDNVGGFTFLKIYPNGDLMGKAFPKEGPYNFIDYRVNGIVSGDQCDVFYTECLKKYPFSEFEGEKFIGESTAWIKMAHKYNMIGINESIYVAEYLESGLTKKGRKLRMSCPQGGMEYSLLCMSTKCSRTRRFKSGVLYNCYGNVLGINILSLIMSNNYHLLTFVTYPLGLLLFYFWKIKYKL